MQRFAGLCVGGPNDGKELAALHRSVAIISGETGSDLGRYHFNAILRTWMWISASDQAIERATRRSRFKEFWTRAVVAHHERGETLGEVPNRTFGSVAQVQSALLHNG